VARRPTKPTKGAAKLRNFLKTQSQAWLAKRVGVGQQTVSAWTSERCRPDSFYRRLLSFVIPDLHDDDWFDTDERRAITRATKQQDAAA